MYYPFSRHSYCILRKVDVTRTVYMQFIVTYVRPHCTLSGGRVYYELCSGGFQPFIRCVYQKIHMFETWLSQDVFIVNYMMDVVGGSLTKKCWMQRTLLTTYTTESNRLLRHVCTLKTIVSSGSISAYVLCFLIGFEYIGIQFLKNATPHRFFYKNVDAARLHSRGYMVQGSTHKTDVCDVFKNQQFLQGVIRCKRCVLYLL